MTFTIAVAGKGGVGKTTFATLSVLHLQHATGEVVLAVDADPNHNLGAKLGTEPGRTLGDLREEMVARGEEPPPGMSKQDYIDYQIKLALKEGGGFDLLTMGRQEGPGCYCYVNNLLRTFLDSLVDRYRYVVIDNEAGMEHLSRRTTRSSDVLFVVCDSSRASLEAAKRISRLADEMRLKVPRKALVFNMLPGGSEGVPGGDYAGFDAVYGVRRSPLLESRSRQAESLLDTPQTDPAYMDIRTAVDAERLRK
jgi:CO dehydrogenase maturation factor